MSMVVVGVVVVRRLLIGRMQRRCVRVVRLRLQCDSRVRILCRCFRDSLVQRGRIPDWRGRGGSVPWTLRRRKRRWRRRCSWQRRWHTWAAGNCCSKTTPGSSSASSTSPRLVISHSIWNHYPNINSTINWTQSRTERHSVANQIEPCWCHPPKGPKVNQVLISINLNQSSFWIWCTLLPVDESSSILTYSNPIHFLFGNDQIMIAIIRGALQLVQWQ